MKRGGMLDKLEYYLLSSTMDDIEPLHMLYKDNIDKVEGATLEAIIKALVKLTNEGMVSCSFSEYRKGSRPCLSITEKELMEHCRGRSDEDLRIYPDPSSPSDYEFEATFKGRIEEDREIYAIYQIDNIKERTLYLCSGDYKSLHFLILALIEDNFLPGILIDGKWEVKIIDVIPILMELLQDSLLECYNFPSQSIDKYHKIDNLREEELVEYINIKHDFIGQPDPVEGKDYYFKTTDAGLKIIEAD